MARKFTPDELRRAFKTLGRVLKTPGVPAMTKAANIVNNDRKKKMDAGLDIDGKPFKPLKPATIKQKRNAGRKKAVATAKRSKSAGRYARAQKAIQVSAANANKPLIREGRFRNARVEATASKGFVKMNRKREGLYGGKTLQAIHNEGLGNVPPRKSWDISKDAEKKVSDFFEKKIIRPNLKRILGT